jgi:broad specificity phosphatase PhoE
LSKTLILVRHAHRDKSRGRSRDNGLSAKGRKQADEFREYWEKMLSKKKPTFLSSPKRRCTETVARLAADLDCRVRVSALLDEQHEDMHESAGRFRGRVKRFLTWWEKKGPEIVVACSHGDWIPELLRVLKGKSKEVAKGDWVVIEK